MAKRKLNAMAVDPGAAPPPAKLEYNPETGNFNRSRATRPRSQVHTQRCVCGKDECKRNVKTCGLSLPPVGSPARLKTLKKLGVQFHPMDVHPRSQQSLMASESARVDPMHYEARPGAKPELTPIKRGVGKGKPTLRRGSAAGGATSGGGLTIRSSRAALQAACEAVGLDKGGKKKEDHRLPAVWRPQAQREL
jgi:hypothetical protein